MTGFHSPSGSESASATEIPPLRPPHVMIGTTPGEKLRKGRSSSTGTATAASRASSANPIDSRPAVTNSALNAIANTSKPIIKNKTALRISSSNFQKASTYFRVWALMPCLVPISPISNPAQTAMIGGETCRKRASSEPPNASPSVSRTSSE